MIMRRSNLIRHRRCDPPKGEKQSPAMKKVFIKDYFGHSSLTMTVGMLTSFNGTWRLCLHNDQQTSHCFIHRCNKQSYFKNPATHFQTASQRILPPNTTLKNLFITVSFQPSKKLSQKKSESKEEVEKRRFD